MRPRPDRVRDGDAGAPGGQRAGAGRPGGRSTMKRRALLAASAAGFLAACAAPEDPSSKLWHSGELVIGTGNTTGVFYVLGAGYAGLINKHLSGYDATAAPTGGSIDNLHRLFSGDIEAMIWSGGIPTPGIVDLFAQAHGQVKFLPIQELLAKVDQKYPNLLDKAVIPKAVYNLPEDVAALTDANLIVVNDNMPADVAYQLTKVLFDYQQDLVSIHPAANGIKRELASDTDPVPQHSGSQHYYSSV